MVMAHNFGRPPAEIAREGGLGVQPMMPLGRSAIADSVFAPAMPPPMRRRRGWQTRTFGHLGMMPPPPMRRPMGMMDMDVVPPSPMTIPPPGVMPRYGMIPQGIGWSPNRRGGPRLPLPYGTNPPPIQQMQGTGLGMYR